jgi:Fe-S-cluster containining protein
MERVLSADDRLPLTCTRLGTCCHGHTILITPWELARLAQGLGQTTRAVRERHTLGGTLLRCDGPPGIHGPPARRVAACSLYDAQRGCTVHQDRPLACRLYPLGRQRNAGKTAYYHPGERLPCIELCPTVSELPAQTVGDYLRSQDLAAGEAAHDAYALLAAGLVDAARTIAEHVPGFDRPALIAHLREAYALAPAERAARLTPAWYDRLTVPTLECGTGDPALFVAAHGQILATSLRNEFMVLSGDQALIRAAKLELTLAAHLAPAVGVGCEPLATLLAGQGAA